MSITTIYPILATTAPLKIIVNKQINKTKSHSPSLSPHSLAHSHDPRGSSTQAQEPQLLHGVCGLRQLPAGGSHHLLLIPGGGCPGTVGHDVPAGEVGGQTNDAKVCATVCSCSLSRGHSIQGAMFFKRSSSRLSLVALMHYPAEPVH